jgi:hypothetical protein
MHALACSCASSSKANLMCNFCAQRSLTWAQRRILLGNSSANGLDGSKSIAKSNFGGQMWCIMQTMPGGKDGTGGPTLILYVAFVQKGDNHILKKVLDIWVTFNERTLLKTYKPPRFLACDHGKAEQLALVSWAFGLTAKPGMQDSFTTTDTHRYPQLLIESFRMSLCGQNPN